MEYMIARVIRPLIQKVRLYSRAQAHRLAKQFKHIGFKHIYAMTRVVNGEESFLADVPIVLDGPVPEAPEVITIGRDCFVKELDNPLTYRGAIARKATRR